MAAALIYSADDGALLGFEDGDRGHPGRGNPRGAVVVEMADARACGLVAMQRAVRCRATMMEA